MYVGGDMYVRTYACLRQLWVSSLERMLHLIICHLGHAHCPITASSLGEILYRIVELTSTVKVSPCKKKTF